MNKLIECNLVVSSEINGKKDCIIVKGKGYVKKDEDFIIYFSSDDMKYKYVCQKEKVIVYCNDSVYVFRENKKDIGKIKNGDYIFEVTTFANKIEVKDNLIIIDYTLRQGNSIIGEYSSQLSF